MKLDEIVQLPGAGSALLALHRWLQRQGITERSAFDLLGCMGRTPPMDGEAALIVARIGKDGADADAMIHALDTLVKLERVEALAKSLGVAVEIPAHLARQFDDMRRRLNGEGGAE